MASREGERRGFLEEDADLGGGEVSLASLFEVQVESPLREVPGRVTFAWPEGHERRVVVKRTDGDVWRDRWYERLRGMERRSQGRREYDNLLGLAADGIRVPRGLGWAEEHGRSLVVMELVPHEVDLREWLGHAGGEGHGREQGHSGEQGHGREVAEDRLRAMITQLVDVVTRLHERGWYHRDLYLQHFVVVEVGKLVLLDVGRARKETGVRRRWFVKDLGALLHSTPEAVGWRWRLRFLAQYLDARGILGRGERRRWAREIEARRRRIAGHVPRFGEERG